MKYDKIMEKRLTFTSALFNPSQSRTCFYMNYYYAFKSKLQESICLHKTYVKGFHLLKYDALV